MIKLYVVKNASGFQVTDEFNRPLSGQVFDTKGKAGDFALRVAMTLIDKGYIVNII